MGKKKTKVEAEPEDSDIPVERDARKPPKKDKGFVKGSNAASGVKPRVRSIDPRFDHIYGEVNPNHVKHRYAFLKEKAKEEASAATDRLKELRSAKRKMQEADWDEEGGEEEEEDDETTALGRRDEMLFQSMLSKTKKGRKMAASSKASPWDYSAGMGGDDFDDDEEANMWDDGDDTAADPAIAATQRRKEANIDNIVNTYSMRDVDSEIKQLQRVTLKHKQAVAQDRVKEREAKVRRDHMKKELDAVRNNEKQSPFFLKKKDLKKEVERARFEEMEKQGGQAMVERFAERKRKRSLKHTAPK